MPSLKRVIDIIKTNSFKTSKMLFVYPACFMSEMLFYLAFLIVIKNSKHAQRFNAEFLTHKKHLNSIFIFFNYEKRDWR
jgi:hypothetical protein